MGLRRNTLRFVAYATVLSIVAHTPAQALPVEGLDSREWHVKRIHIEGNESFGDSVLSAEFATLVRPWYTPWRSRPVFDPVAFDHDLARLRRFYEAHGFFDARVVYDIEAEDVGGADLLTLTFWIEENQPSTVAVLDFETPGPFSLPPSLPLRTGERFDEDAYQKSEGVLKRFFLENGYAHVTVERSATVDAAAHRVSVRYRIAPGPLTVFGETAIEGTRDVDPEVVRQDLEWNSGGRFQLTKIEDSRENLMKTDLFSSARIGWQTTGEQTPVPMLVKVDEKPPHEIKVGVGFATDEKYRVQLRWANHDFFGGGREMMVGVKYSAIDAAFLAKFTQPHFLSQHTSGVLEFRQDRDDEDNYVLYASQLHPRLEHRFSKTLSGALGYRIEADKFTDVDPATVSAIGSVRDQLTLFGPTLGMEWNTTENPLDPHRGGVLTANTELAGAGDFQFWKARIEGRKYTEVGWDTVLANRLQFAFADALGPIEDLPLSERLYAGGEGSVRGYGRRRLGPRSTANDPIGGLSSIEGSFELRHAITGALGGALFFDFGQVTTRRFDVPVDDLRHGVGFGVSYMTPVGPLRLDIGFPVERPSGDSPVALYFSIGQFF